MGIFPKKSVHDHQLHICFFQNRLGKFIRVFPSEYNTLDTCIHQHFCTDHTGLQSNIDCRTFCAYADFRRLNDSVLFCVQGTAQFMALTGRDIQSCSFATADFCTMLQSGRRTVIACCNNTIVLYNNCTNLSAQTSRSCFYDICDFHEIFIPAFSHC